MNTDKTPPIFAKRSLSSKALFGTKRWSSSVDRDKAKRKERLLKKKFSIKLEVKPRHAIKKKQKKWFIDVPTGFSTKLGCFPKSP